MTSQERQRQWLERYRQHDDDDDYDNDHNVEEEFPLPPIPPPPTSSALFAPCDASEEWTTYEERLTVPLPTANDTATTRTTADDTATATSTTTTYDACSPCFSTPSFMAVESSSNFQNNNNHSHRNDGNEEQLQPTVSSNGIHWSQEDGLCTTTTTTGWCEPMEYDSGRGRGRGVDDADDILLHQSYYNGDGRPPSEEGFEVVGSREIGLDNDTTTRCSFPKWMKNGMSRIPLLWGGSGSSSNRDSPSTRPKPPPSQKEETQHPSQRRSTSSSPPNNNNTKQQILRGGDQSSLDNTQDASMDEETMGIFINNLPYYEPEENRKEENGLLSWCSHWCPTSHEEDNEDNYQPSKEKHEDDDDDEEKEKGIIAWFRGGSYCWMMMCCLILAIILISIFASRGNRRDKNGSEVFQSNTMDQQGLITLAPTSSAGDGGVVVPTPTFPITNTNINGTTNTTAGGGNTTTTTTPPTGVGISDQLLYPQNYTSQYMVGAYYYPWHGSDFHRRAGYVRSQLVPQQFPTLGEYDDTDPNVIKQHFEWSHQANINLWVTSWWGPGKQEDSTTLNVILDHDDIGDLKIALHYETTGRVSERTDYSTANVVPDITYMCENYFDHDNYYKINNRPVIVIYVTRALERIEGKLEEVTLLMRSAAGKCGHSVYLIGDHVFSDPPDPSTPYGPFLYFDAVTNYDVYGSMKSGSVYAGRDVVDSYYDRMGQWQDQAKQQNCRFIPAVSPGFNDRGVRLSTDHRALSRRLTADSEPGSFFSYSLSKAIALVDEEADNLLLVNSFNEWHEDSQIEPVVGETTNIPDLLTQGVEYQGYGDLYLNLLREGTIDYPSSSSSAEIRNGNVFSSSP